MIIKLSYIIQFKYSDIYLQDMGQFIGRKDELSVLQEFYDGSFVKAYSIIGRRQIGKTSLIDEFVKDKDHVKFEFLKSSLDKNLQMIGLTMSSLTGVRKEYNSSLEFLWDLAEYIKGKKIVVVFDEFPYMVECDESFPASVQHFIDVQLGDSKLIVSGSSIKTMKYETQDYSRPLYGRTRPLWVRQMGIRECSVFHLQLPDIEQLKLYMAVGGVPLYHAVPGFADFEDYVEKMILGPLSPFRNEGEDMIRRELDHSNDIIAILDSMRGRRTAINEISSRTGIDRNICRVRLKDMKLLGMISEINPMWGAPKRFTYYRITDHMLSFSYLVKRNETSYNASLSEKYKALAQLISTSRGLMFESFCADLLCASYAVRTIGSWWGEGPLLDRWGDVKRNNDGTPRIAEQDIDIAAEVMSNNNLVNLAVECKFTDYPTGFDALNELESAVGCIGKKRYVRKMIISPSGFTEELTRYSEENGILLVGLDMIMGRKPMPPL